MPGTKGLTPFSLRFLTALLLTSLGLAPHAAQAQAGLLVDKPSAVRKLVPAESLEKQAAQQYVSMMGQAAEKKTLAPDTAPALQHLREIAQRLIPHAARFNRRAPAWTWEINLIASDEINAFCMPGGKIVFYTGILDKLALTENEIAAVMGHEMAHALREHARERIAKTQLTRLGASILGELVGGGRYAGAFDVGGSLLTLKFSREDESEADLVGLEISARGGYDPRAGITLWQKMEKAGGGKSLQWLSTHPSGKHRIADMQRAVPVVMPLYEASRKALPHAPSR